MENRVLKYFLMVAREENITRAAMRLHITQPTLSRQLIQLEEELGRKLFSRKNPKITLTEDGLLLKRRAEEIIYLTEKIKKDFQEKDNELVGEINIGSGDFKNSRILAKIIAAFHEKYPLITFDIYSGNSDNIKDRIEKGILDVGLLIDPVDISKYSFIRMPLKDRWGAFVSKNSELAKKDKISAVDLFFVPLILTRRQMIQNELLNWFGNNSDKINIIAKGNMPYNLANLTGENLGIFINLELDYNYTELKFLPLNPEIETTTVLVWKKDQPLSSITTHFIEFATEYLSGISQNLL